MQHAGFAKQFVRLLSVLSLAVRQSSSNSASQLFHSCIFILGYDANSLIPKTSVLRMLSSTSSLLMLNNVLALTGINASGVEDLLDLDDDES